MNLMTDDLQATLRNGQTLCLHDALRFLQLAASC
jgi:hypothetical protein